MHIPSPKTLLVIDDAEGFRERIVEETQALGWQAYATNDLIEAETWLAKHTPEVVLLDFELPGQNRRDYADLLKRNGLLGRTLLITATLDERRRQYIAEYGLAGVRVKPLDMERLEDALTLPPQANAGLNIGDKELAAVIDTLPIAANMLDEALLPIWGNGKASQEPISQEQGLIIRWLYADMADNGASAARRVDWDGEKHAFLETRLYRLGPEGYWLARDWRKQGDRPHDHELLNLEDSSGRLGWLMAVAKLLAQRYAISRLRVYKIAPLPDCLHPSAPPARLVIPLFQSGGGFATSYEAWWHTGFLAEDSPNTLEALADGYVPTPMFRRDGEYPCHSIGFGTKGTYRVQFPVRDLESKQVIALLAMDRRLDHAEGLSGFDGQVVSMARRMAGDAMELDEAQWWLMHGLVEDIGRRLCKWLSDGEEKRIHRWHERISTALKDTFASPDRSPEMTYDGLSQICRRLAESWKEETISGHVMGISSWGETASPAPISAWHIALKTDDDHWQAVAGWGSVYEACKPQGLRPLSAPHALIRGQEAWKAIVIQHYGEWSDTTNGHCHCDRATHCRETGSWLAVPMEVSGTIRAMMLVYSPHPCYFTAFRVSLMEAAAKRLLPLLAAALRETLARSAFALSVMHEVKNDAHAALMTMEALPETALTPRWRNGLLDIHHHLEGLQDLGQDTLDIFRLGLGSQGLTQTSNDPDAEHVLNELVTRATSGWQSLYEDTRLRIDLPPDLGQRSFRIARPRSLKRVLRVLLHNAFRHGRELVQVAVALEHGPGSSLDTRIKFTVGNLAFPDTVLALRQQDNALTAGTSASPIIRGKIGLTVAHQLTVDAGGVLGDFTIAEGGTDLVPVHIALSWPCTPVGILSVGENHE